MRPLIVAGIALTLTSPAWALREGTPGTVDPRVVTAPYVPGEIYAVHIPQGQTMQIALPPDEYVTDAYGSDKKMISADYNANMVMIWTGEVPVAQRSIFVLTKKPDSPAAPPRSYTFLVDTVAPDRGEISFAIMPDPKEAAARHAAQQAARWRQMQAEKAQKDALAALTTASPDHDSNFKYVLQGEKPEDWDLLPTRQVSDNDAETHFVFPGNMRIPIIYAVNPDGKEAVVEPTFDSTTGVSTVHQLARAFHLRDGDALLCVFNKAFNPVGTRGESGTSTPDVERVTK